MQRSPATGDVVGGAILTILILVIYVPITELQINQRLVPNDFKWHLNAVLPAMQGQIRSPHFLFQIVVALIYKMLPHQSVESAAAIVIVGSQIITGAVLYFGFYRSVDKVTSGFIISLRILLTILTMVVFDVAVLYFIDGHLYFGQVGLTSYHNPTIQLLKPIAAWLFLLVVKSMEEPKNASACFYALLISSTVLSGLAKPTYIMCIVPASAVMMFLGDRERPIALWPMLIGLWLPTCCLLVWQYSFEYGGDNAVSVLWAPLLVFLHDSELWTLIPKFVTGLTFPLVTLAMYPRVVLGDRASVLGWIAMGVASIYAYLVAEGPPRTFHGNLWWGMETCGFILFAVTGRILLVKVFSIVSGREALSYRIVLCLSSFLLHVAFGIVWYIDNYRLHRNW